MTLLISCLLGALYSILIGLISHAPWSALIAWPLLTLLLWYTFRKFKLLRYCGYFAVLPVSILAFEVTRTIIHPSIYAFKYLALDRSHYTPGIRATMPPDDPDDLDSPAVEVKEILIAKDGFRADPKTGQGNPERCRLALIGDSMIYGSGSPYADTLGPVLAAMGADGCVFGVTGNTPTDYLATLKYVAKRTENGAHIAIYLYAYNDFVGLSKYFRRRLRALSDAIAPLAQLIVYYDDWRRTTFIHGLFRQKSNGFESPRTPWELKIGETKTLTFYYPRDPVGYVPPPPLNKGQRAALEVFFRRLHEFTYDHSWRVSIVIIPDSAELVANFARQSLIFQDLDPRRADALRICQKFPFGCEDLTPYLYQRTLDEVRNPYLINDRHFSAFGTRVVAEHFLAVTRHRFDVASGAETDWDPEAES